MLEVCGLTKRFGGIAVVEDVSFSLGTGEILGYVGPNGAGKSTTVKMIIGLLEPSEGQVRFQGRSVIEDLTGFQARIGYVPEEPQTYPYLSGREYLQLTGRLRGVSRGILEAKIDEFLQLFSLWEDRHCPVSAYSKGMRQKILLAAALLHNPDLLILDEPLSGLDAAASRQVKDLLRARVNTGRTVVLTTHVLEVAERLADRIGIINAGRMVAEGTFAELRHRAGNGQETLEDVFLHLTAEQPVAEQAA